MYVCVTTPPKPLNRFAKKLSQQIERLTLIAIGYLDLKYLPQPYLKPPKTHFWGLHNVKPMGNRGLL